MQDLDIAESMFNVSDEEKFIKMQNRYGGYWRYPQMLDFYFLVNPYFPPQKLIDELKAAAEKLLTQYPSGMYVNSLLAAKNFGVAQKNILVGNGAAELIKSLMNSVSGRIGIVRPTFEEYPNRYGDTVSFTPQNENFSYGVEDLINYFGDKNISALVVINPDNPSGNYISQGKILQLLEWARAKNIFLIVDESFIDFADENATLIEQEILDANKNLCVVKSISKSYGVAGVRLGVLASGNENLIAALKKDVAIWNINSFAEFYLQIYEKYKSDYVKSLALLREERRRFQEELGKIQGVRVIPSQANFVMVEILGVPAREVAKNLLAKKNIFVKDLSAKITGGNYLRIAVRDFDDNNKILAALKEELFRTGAVTAHSAETFAVKDLSSDSVIAGM